jgi:hypothetical protein
MPGFREQLAPQILARKDPPEVRLLHRLRSEGEERRCRHTYADLINENVVVTHSRSTQFLLNDGLPARRKT